MTTSAPPTADELRDNLDAARERTREAERDLGSASLERKGTKALSDALDQAHAEERRLELAITEAERRQTGAEAEAAVEARRQERIAIYESVADYLPRVDAYARARAALDVAEADLVAHPPHGVISHLKYLFWTWSDRRVADLDKRLIGAVPKPPRKGHTDDMPDPAKYGAERIAELSARAAELIEAEQRGENIAVTAAEDRERRTRRHRIQVAERRGNRG